MVNTGASCPALAIIVGVVGQAPGKGKEPAAIAVRNEL